MTLLQETDILLDLPELPDIPLPKGWSQYTLLAVLHVIALARIIVLNVANWPDKECDGLRLRCENHRLRGEVDILQREIAIKDARFSRIETKKRPTYNATERFEILAIKALRGWSNEKIAKRFQISERSIRRWFRGSETQSGITQMPEVVSRYPDYVRNIVRRLKGCCPMLGRYKIAGILCRAGLHLSASTVKRCIDEPPNLAQTVTMPPEFTAPQKFLLPKDLHWALSRKPFRRSIRIAFMSST